MKSFLVATCLLLASFNAGADEEGGTHTPNVCSTTHAQVCAHLLLLSPLSSQTEGQFIAHVMVPADEAIQNFKLDLWMDMNGHGHSSAPVDIAPLDEPNHFKITQAWFVMEGPWLVRLDFDLRGEHFHLEIPVQIAE